MQLPSILQGESLTRLLQGAFVGFVATVVIGFGWGGWTLGSTAKQMAEKIQELNQDAQRQSEICLALKSYVIAEFSPETQGKAFERLYGI